MKKEFLGILSFRVKEYFNQVSYRSAKLNKINRVSVLQDF